MSKAENPSATIHGNINGSQMTFLELLVHEHKAHSIIGAVRWCIDNSIKIENEKHNEKK